MDDHQLGAAILKIRLAIRGHREQKGDDRCWLDDYLVWKFVGNISEELPSYEEGMKKCRAFYNYRNSGTLDNTSADTIFDHKKWDEDLNQKDTSELNSELNKLQEGIKKHRDINGRERTLQDDKLLYDLLPEKMPADFRLPSKEDFLGTAKPDAGCPNFWNSHADCQGKHNLHQWGPCR